MAERHPTYNLIKNDDATSRFFMNEVALLVFGSGGKRYHLTEALNGCFAVFLISPRATVSAHIPPHPGVNFEDPQAGDKNLIAQNARICCQVQGKRKVLPWLPSCLDICSVPRQNPAAR